MSATIFISYASKDRKVAESVCNALENRGLKCWISSRDIHGGENFQEAIVRAIRGAKVMLLIFSANANNSDELKKELVVAGQSKLVVVPLRVEEVTPNDAFSYELATRQWIDMFDNWERSLDMLVSHLTSIVGIVAPPGAAPPAPAPVSAPVPLPEAPPPPPPVQPAPKMPEKPAAAQPPAAASATPRALPKLGRTPLIAMGGGVAALLVVWLGWTLYRESPPVKPPSSASIPAAPPNPAPTPAPNPVPTPTLQQKSAPPPVQQPAPPPVQQPSSIPLPAMNPIEANRRGEAAEDSNNLPEAVRWYRQSADQGNARAQNNLGYLYSHGKGVPLDYAESMRWYRRAADQGDPLGETNVGVLYQNGWSVKQDYAEAIRWYRKAADQKFGLAEYRLGLMYDSGFGVTRSPLIARTWMVEASGHGNEDAKKWLTSHE